MAIRGIIWNDNALRGIHGAKAAVRGLVGTDASRRFVSLIAVRKGDQLLMSEYQGIDFVIVADYPQDSSAAGHLPESVKYMEHQRGFGKKELVYVGNCTADIEAAKSLGLQFFITLTGEFTAKDRAMLLDKYKLLPEQIVYSAELVPARIRYLDQTLRHIDATSKTAA